MKKIVLRSPVDYRLGEKVLSFRRDFEYFVEDDVANSAFISQFIKTVEDVAQEKKRVRRKKKDADS